MWYRLRGQNSGSRPIFNRWQHIASGNTCNLQSQNPLPGIFHGISLGQVDKMVSAVEEDATVAGEVGGCLSFVSNRRTIRINYSPNHPRGRGREGVKNTAETTKINGRAEFLGVGIYSFECCWFSMRKDSIRVPLATIIR